MKTLSLSDNWLVTSIKILSSGGIVIFPSDTLYGALVDATNNKAVEKLIRFKSRPPGKPISVFVDSFSMLAKYAKLTASQNETLNELLPGPFTVILDSKYIVNSMLESEKGTLGLRFPTFEPIIRLVNEFEKPLSATSANMSGHSPHYSVQSLLKDFSQTKKDLVDLIVDAGELPRNKPSTIIDLTSSEIKLLRQGDILLSNQKTFISKSASQTQKIAQHLITKYASFASIKPLIIILQGPMGAGKTQFVKGVGSYLGISDIVSPTFVVYCEYPVNKSGIKNLIHFDLFDIQESEEFNHLGLGHYLKPGHVWCIEWGEKSGPIIEKLKQEAYVIDITISYQGNDERSLIIDTHIYDHIIN